MKAHLAKLSLALLSAAFLLGCQEQASSPVEPDGVAPLFGAKTCDEIPGCRKDKEGGGDKGGDKSTVSVELAGGMVSAEQLVQLTGQNNAKVVNLGGPVVSHTMLMANTAAAGVTNPGGDNCVSEGVFNGDFSAGDMLALLEDGAQDRHISVTVDKQAVAVGEASLKHKINSAWRELSSESGNLITGGGIAGNSNKGAFTLLNESDIGPVTPPTVTATPLDGDKTEYTFQDGIMWIRQLGFDGLLVCHNLDVVVVTVDLTPPTG